MSGGHGADGIPEILRAEGPAPFPGRNNTSYGEWVTARLRALHAKYVADAAAEAPALRYYQALARALVADPEFGVGARGGARGALLYHGMGTGKTRLALAVAQAMPEGVRTVVVAPKSLQAAFLAASDALVAATRPGAGAEAGAGLAARQAAARARLAFVTLNAHNAAAQAEEALAGGFADALVVVDEAHNFFRGVVNAADDAANARRLYHLLMGARGLRLLFLSGTPIVKHPFELVPAVNLLTGAETLPTDYGLFVDLYVDEEGLVAKNRGRLANRLVGLVSYVPPPAAAEGTPAELPTVVEEVEMGADQYAAYLTARFAEETRAATGGGMGAPLSIPGRSADGFGKYFVRSRTLGDSWLPPGADSVAAVPDAAFDRDTVSPKAWRLLENLRRSPGPALVYSQFVERGLGVVARYLRRAGYEEVADPAAALSALASESFGAVRDTTAGAAGGPAEDEAEGPAEGEAEGPTEDEAEGPPEGPAGAEGGAPRSRRGRGRRGRGGSGRQGRESFRDTIGRQAHGTSFVPPGTDTRDDLDAALAVYVRHGVYTDAEERAIRAAAGDYQPSIGIRRMTDDSPRIAYRPEKDRGLGALHAGRLFNLHRGQRKLFVGELQLFTELLGRADAEATVLYVGAAAGYHIPFLAHLFPGLSFVLVDPGEFGIRATPRIEIRREFFTDAAAEAFAAAGGVDVFISDIRLSDRGETEAFRGWSPGFEEQVGEDMAAQARWARALRPRAGGLLKFRLPYLPPGVQMTTEYLPGAVLFQAWAPKSSTETRLLFRAADAEAPPAAYDVAAYQDACAYRNFVLRPWGTFRPPVPGLEAVEGYDRCVDCTNEALAWVRYKALPGGDPRSVPELMAATGRAFRQPLAGRPPPLGRGLADPARASHHGLHPAEPAPTRVRRVLDAELATAEGRQLLDAAPVADEFDACLEAVFDEEAGEGEDAGRLGVREAFAAAAALSLAEKHRALLGDALRAARARGLHVSVLPAGAGAVPAPEAPLDLFAPDPAAFGCGLYDRAAAARDPLAAGTRVVGAAVDEGGFLVLDSAEAVEEFEEGYADAEGAVDWGRAGAENPGLAVRGRRALAARLGAAPRHAWLAAVGDLRVWDPAALRATEVLYAAPAFINAGGAGDICGCKGGGAPPLGRFAVISGAVAPAARAALVALFNAPANARGAALRVLLVSKTGAEGLDLWGVRQVHVFEPYWDAARTRQVIARGVRAGSHAHLPPAERTVQPYVYVAADNRAARARLAREGSELAEIERQTIDAALLERAGRAQRLVDDFLGLLRDVSMECALFGYGACHACAPTGAPLYHADPVRDLALADPCAPAREVEARPVRLGGETYYYVATAFGPGGAPTAYEFFEFDAALGAHTPVDPRGALAARLAEALARGAGGAAGAPGE